MTCGAQPVRVALAVLFSTVVARGAARGTRLCRERLFNYLVEASGAALSLLASYDRTGVTPTEPWPQSS